MKHLLLYLLKFLVLAVVLWGVAALFDKYNLLLILFVLWQSHRIDKLENLIKDKFEILEKNQEHIKKDSERFKERTNNSIEYVQKEVYKINRKL